jgi:hypothetical protein
MYGSYYQGRGIRQMVILSKINLFSSTINQTLPMQIRQDYRNRDARQKLRLSYRRTLHLTDQRMIVTQRNNVRFQKWSS